MARLVHAMYGTRDAPQLWMEEISNFLVEIGFIPGVANPRVFVHGSTGLRLTIHVDDMAVVGMPADLRWLRDSLAKRYELKSQVLGPGANEDREIQYLVRVVTWRADGVGYEANPKHLNSIFV